MIFPYSEIASLLEEVSHIPRGGKADLVAEFLSNLETNQVCPAIRLLSGKLWPAWDRREMNVGPGLLEDVLHEISQEDILKLKERLGEMGAVAEAALSSKIQQPISSEPLEALWVYESIYRISNQNGQESERRKSSIMRGLFLEASPIEGKYIARTILRNISIGLGSNAFLQAVAKAFNYDHLQLQNAYALLPEIGLLAESACRREIEFIKFLPPRPVKPMIITRGRQALNRIFLPKYPGIRIQLHWIKQEMFVYTSRLKDITKSLNGLLKDISNISHDFVIEGEIIIFRNSQMLGIGDAIKYINQIYHPELNRVYPAVVAHDLLFIGGQDLMNLPYEMRQSKLASLLGDPRILPFRGLNPVQKMVLQDELELEKAKRELNESGYLGLIAKDLKAPYLPGMHSNNDFLISFPKGQDERLAY
jgi:DNA ligase-1